MINHTNLIDAFIGSRFYIFELADKAMIYENCPEEGDGVKKRLHICEDKEAAEGFLLVHKQAYKAYLLAIVKVEPGNADVAFVLDQPNTNTTKASLRRRKSRKKPDTAKPCELTELENEN